MFSVTFNYSKNERATLSFNWSCRSGLSVKPSSEFTGPQETQARDDTGGNDAALRILRWRLDKAQVRRCETRKDETAIQRRLEKVMLFVLLGLTGFLIGASVD
jgi:hypothetical protein